MFLSILTREEIGRASPKILQTPTRRSKRKEKKNIAIRGFGMHIIYAALEIGKLMKLTSATYIFLTISGYPLDIFVIPLILITLGSQNLSHPSYTTTLFSCTLSYITVFVYIR